MGSQLSLQPEQASPVWRSLVRPALVGSLVLHGLVLTTPIFRTQELSPEAEAAEPEEVSIALSSLQSLNRPRPAAVVQPSPQSTPIQRVIEPRPNPVPAPVVVSSAEPTPIPSPSLAPSPEPSPDPSPSVAEQPQSPEPKAEAAIATLTAPADSDTTTPASDTEPTFDPQPFQQAFAQRVAAGSGVIGLAPPASYFGRRSELYFTASTISDTKDATTWIPGIIGIDWYNDVRPTDAIASIQASLPEATLVPMPEGYGNRELYEVQDTEGRPVVWLNIIPAPGNISTVVVQWNRDPNQPIN